MMRGRKCLLLIIDPQRSFCADDVPVEAQQVVHDGELCVPGAKDDMLRVAEFIRKFGPSIDDITVTLDSHHPLHIAHPIWYTFPDTKKHPDPFTTMIERNGEIINGVLKSDQSLDEIGHVYCTRRGFTAWTVSYLRKLREGKRYPHMIWPPHCLIGSVGATIVQELFDALCDWETSEFGVVNMVTKGSNIRTEHFGAVRSEVVDPHDPTTQVNPAFLEPLQADDTDVLVCGEARGHCLANTVRDATDSFADDSFVQRLTLLSDGTSDVENLEFLGDDFVNDFSARGMQVKTMDEF